MKHIYGMTREMLEEYLLSIDSKKFHATQIFEWLYRKKCQTLEDMSNISKQLSHRMKEDFQMDTLRCIAKQEAKDVKKYLFELSDGNHIETVLMKHNYGNSLCVSTQVGCNMGCLFCESGKLKKVRNLEAHEMVLQVLMSENECKERISSVVLMGIGEPLDNYENVMKFIRIINDAKGLAIGIRHITISTCGILPKIEHLQQENLQVNLAISLHAPNDTLRTKIMPINKVYPLSKLLPTIKQYIAVTNRRVTFEYIMLDGINDSKECAIELSKLLKHINCYVNLIPYNKTSNQQLKRSNEKHLKEFYDILIQNGLTATCRKEFGGKVDAACGQLRSKHEAEF